MIDIHHTPSWYCYYCCMTTSKQSVKCRSTKYPKVSCWSSSPVGVLSTPASNGCWTTNFPRLALTNPWILPTLRWCSTMPAVEPLYHPLIELKKGPQGRTKLRKGPTGPTAVVFYSYTWSSAPKIADLPMVHFFLWAIWCYDYLKMWYPWYPKTPLFPLSDGNRLPLISEKPILPNRHVTDLHFMVV